MQKKIYCCYVSRTKGGKTMKTVCPRCGEDAVVEKTKTYLITRCDSCGFEMGNPRELEMS